MTTFLRPCKGRRAVCPPPAAAATDVTTRALPTIEFEATFADVGLGVTVLEDSGANTVTLRVTADPARPSAVLHWGIDGWEAPAKAAWPPGTVAVDAKAVQTPIGAGFDIVFDANASPRGCG